MQIVSLTTDFGINDFYSAKLKAKILSSVSHINIVDITHQLSPYDIAGAALMVKSVYREFPVGTIHVIAVYNHYDYGSFFLALHREGQFFIAPDNGVLTLIFEDLNPEELRKVSHENLASSSIADIVSEGIKRIVRDGNISKVGLPVDIIESRMRVSPVVAPDEILGTIIHIDTYGNVMVNVDRELFERVGKGRPFEIYFKHVNPIKTLSVGYGDVSIGEALAIFNGAGFLEIAVNMDSANKLLNLDKDETIQIIFS